MKNERRSLQSVIADPIRGFLSHHRALGKRFLTEERALNLFDYYVAEQKVESLTAITPSLLENFLSSRSRKSTKSYNHLLGVLRRWFDWLVAQERLPQSPLQTKPRRITGVRPPFLFDQTQARALLAVAAQLPDNNRGRQRGLIYPMIFGLLYGLGLRVSEAARLRLQDIDWERGVLRILETKFAKSRLVPFGPKMGVRLKEYLQKRELQVGRLEPDDPLFSFGPEKSCAINPGTVSQTFHQLLPKLGLSLASGVAAPRLHCLRHSFAVGTLLRWYRQGINPQDRLLHLSTFMGHTHPTSTAVYLTITAELLQEANTRFHRLASPLLKEVAS
jgi:site-specific recombinase XerD